jgi:hypothetical protein
MVSRVLRGVLRAFCFQPRVDNLLVAPLVQFLADLNPCNVGAIANIEVENIFKNLVHKRNYVFSWTHDRILCVEAYALNVTHKAVSGWVLPEGLISFTLRQVK